MHVTMVLWFEYVLASRVKLVNLCLDLRVYLWMGEDAKEEAGQRAGCGVRPGDHGKDPIVDKLTSQRGWVFRAIFVVLWSIS